MINGFKEYLKKEGKSINTIKTYARHIKNYINWIHDTTGEEVKKLYRTNILEYKSYLQNIKKSSAKTINNKLSSLIKFNNYLIENNIQKDIVLSKKDFIKIQTQVANLAIINKTEGEGFRQKVLEGEGLRNYAIVTIMAYAGLRISEVLQLKIFDIDLIAKELIVKNGKGNKERVVYINSKIVEAVKEYLKERKQDATDYLFVSNKGGKIDRTVINKVFKKYSNKITPHTLRHFYCSNALENGFTIAEVANQAGHSNIHTTLLYTNPSKEKMKNKTELL